MRFVHCLDIVSSILVLVRIALSREIGSPLVIELVSSFVVSPFPFLFFLFFSYSPLFFSSPFLFFVYTPSLSLPPLILDSGVLGSELSVDVRHFRSSLNVKS